MISIYSLCYGILFLIIGEVIYIYMCKKSSTSEVRNDWIGMKGISFVFSSFIIIAVAYIINIIQSHGIYVIITILCITIIILFFCLNKKIGLHFAKKNKHKTNFGKADAK